MGLILIVALYFAQKYRIIQTILIIAWGIALYGVLLYNWSNAYATFIPAMLILLYNPETGGQNQGYEVFVLFILSITSFDNWNDKCIS